MSEIIDNTKKATPVKKGKKSWQPVQLLGTFNKKPNVAYRWVRKDEANIQKKLAEGWRPINKTSGAMTDVDDYDTFKTQSSLDSTRTRRDLVLFGLDEDMAEARREYYAQQSEAMLKNIQKETRQGIEKSGAPVTGKIIIE